RSRWTMASMSASTLIARTSLGGDGLRRSSNGALSQGLLEQADDAGHRDAHPVGPVVQLVAQLVDRLLELEDREHGARGRLAGWHQGRVDGLEVALHEGVAGAILPALRGHPTALQIAGRGGVGEGAQHAGDVAQRRALAAALEQRPRRLALEVEDDPAVVAQHRLPEVQVAVRADE